MLNKEPLDYYRATAKRLGINLDDLMIPHFPMGRDIAVKDIIASPDLIKEKVPLAVSYLSNPNERGTALAVVEKMFYDRRRLENLLEGSGLESVLNMEYTFKIFASTDVPLVCECVVLDGQITATYIVLPLQIKGTHPTNTAAVRAVEFESKPPFPLELMKKGADYKPFVEWMLKEYARKQ